MADGRIPGFQEMRCEVGGAEYYAQTAGAGPALLLLHGFPETSFCWREVAPALAADHTVVAADLRGYGASRAPAGGPHGEGFSKREIASELAEAMSDLGHESFAVAGHDRGARVAYRLALDHPDRVSRVAVVNAIPTIEQFERMGEGASLGFWPFFLLAQPAPFPERLVGADPQAVLDHIFATWPEDQAAIDPEARAAYLAALDAETIAAICSEYRAAFHIDRAHDAEDRDRKRRIEPPLLVITSTAETQLADAPLVWRTWAEHEVAAAEVPGGHFAPEEAPGELAAALSAFLAPARTSAVA
jgi:haloacetate dehalogenase